MRSTCVTTSLLLGLVACGAPERPGDTADVGSTGSTSEGTSGGPSTGVPDSSGGEGSSTSGEPTTSGGPGSTDSSSSSSSSEGSSTGGGGPTPGAFCDPIPACDAAPPKVPGQGAEESELSRGRDMFYAEGEDQWVIAKFTKWGFPLDKDIEGVPVHIFLDRGCEGAWEELGVAVTTVEGEHPTIEGVDDTGGRVYFKIPEADRLELGRHRVHLVVEEYWNTAEVLIDVVPAGAPFFVSDVDGTLTTSENAEAWDFLLGTLPDPHPFAAEALSLLASKGYRPMYITARPEWLDRRTREFVAVHGFPPGLIHTTLTYTGGTGDTAAAYKTEELAMLAGKGLVPSWLFGNKDSDAKAFDTAGVPPDHRIFYQFTDALYGGRRIESYEELLDEFAALPDLCDP